MNVGFFLVDGIQDLAIASACAAGLVASVERTMPGVPVVQFTDETTPAVDGVYEVRRLPREPMALLRTKHHAQAKGEWLFVDSDVLITRDVSDVMARGFDIGLTTRNWPHLKPAVGFASRMPFNIGVVFSRHRKFWQEVHERVSAMTPELQEWMGDQQAVCDMVGRTRHHYAFLKGSIYNLPPSLDDADGLNRKMMKKAAILHFKGPERKAMMLEYLQCVSV